MTKITKEFLLQRLDQAIISNKKWMKISAIICVICIIMCKFLWEDGAIGLLSFLGMLIVIFSSVFLCEFASYRSNVKHLQMRTEAIELGGIVIREDEIYDKYYESGGDDDPSYSWIYGKMYGRRDSSALFNHVLKGSRVYYISLKEEFAQKSKLQSDNYGDYMASEYVIGDDLKACLIPYDPVIGEDNFTQMLKTRKASWSPLTRIKCKKCGTKFKLRKQSFCPECGVEYIVTDADIMHHKEWYE